MALQDRIGFLLRSAYQDLNKGFRQQLVEENITTHQYVVLSGLGDLGSSIQRTLAEYCAIEPSNLNVMIKKMKSAGLVESVVSTEPGTGRGNSDAVTLTARGREIVDRFRKVENSSNRQFLEPLSRKDQDKLHELLKKLR